MSPFREDETPVNEPVRGLPEPLPEGETILWQAQPGTLSFAVHVFHIRFVAAYLVIMVAWRMAARASAGAPASELQAIATSGAVLGGVGLLLVMGLAWVIARSAIFTLTEKRIVMRYGVAIRKYVNLPLAQISSADLRLTSGGHGDIALATTGRSIGYIYLWPFARPLRFAPSFPSLRAIPDAANAAQLIATTYAAFRAENTGERPQAVATHAPASNQPAATAKPSTGGLPAGVQPA